MRQDETPLDFSCYTGIASNALLIHSVYTVSYTSIGTAPTITGESRNSTYQLTGQIHAVLQKSIATAIYNYYGNISVNQKLTVLLAGFLDKQV